MGDAAAFEDNIEDCQHGRRNTGRAFVPYHSAGQQAAVQPAH